VEDRYSLHWKVVGSGRTNFRGYDTVEGFSPEICGCGDLKSPKAEAPKQMTIIDFKVHMWCQIYNSGYKELQRKEEGESVEVPKDISIVDQGGGRRTIELVEEEKFPKQE
jgi:hypothetical protein